MQPAYPWTKDEARIIKAAWATDAGRLALNLIVERLGLLHAHSISADPVEMALLPGRRFVAVELASVINTPLDHIVKEPNDDRSSSRPISATERAARVAAGLDPTGRKPGRTGRRSSDTATGL